MKQYSLRTISLLLAFGGLVGCQQDEVSVSQSIAPTEETNHDSFSRNDDIKESLRKIDQSRSEGPIERASREYLESRALFQELNGQVSEIAVLATYRGSSSRHRLGAEQNDPTPVFREMALCGVKTTGQKGEQFVILHVGNIRGKWMPMHTAETGDCVLWAETKPTAEQIRQQIHFPNPNIGERWDIDERIVQVDNWEEFVVGGPPINFHVKE